MKNLLLYNLKSKIKLNIKGRNINNFIKRLNINEINIFKIKNINNEEVNIIIDNKDYDKVLNLKTIYEIKIIDNYGMIRIKTKIKLYKFIIIFMLLGLCLIYILSKIIFYIDIVVDNKELKKELYNELDIYNIKKYKFKKNYDDLQIIKEEIINKYKNKIEWLEIIDNGTKYIVKVEERIIKNNIVDNNKKNTIAKKDSIIKKIITDKGVIEKEINQFVKKGDTIISGGNGFVFGEVWYTVTIEYPYFYEEIIQTNNTKNLIGIQILNKTFIGGFKNKSTNDNILLKHNFLPIKLILQNQKEFVISKNILLEEEAIKVATNEAINKMDSLLDSGEEISSYKLLSSEKREDKVIVKVFFTILENVAQYEEVN